MKTGQIVAVSALAVLVVGWAATLLTHRGPKYAAAVLAGWVVPGLGHVLIGRPIKGLVFFGLLTLTYVTGMTLIGWHSIAYDDQPFYYIGQYGSGVTWLLAELLGGVKPFTNPKWPMAWHDPGLLYVAASGLLNLVIVLNLYQPRLPQPEKPA